MYHTLHDPNIEKEMDLPFKVGDICRNDSSGDYIIILGYRKRIAYIETKPQYEVVAMFLKQSDPGKIYQFTLASMKLIYRKIEEED